jgi:predicted aspartyl protease
MHKKATFDYYDNDPLVVVTLVNPVLGKRYKACAYLDTGSDAVVIPGDIWFKLGLDKDLMASVSVVGDTVNTWYNFIDLEFLQNKHNDIEVFYNEAAGDILIGRNILDEYSVTFDGRNSKLYIE